MTTGWDALLGSQDAQQRHKKIARTVDKLKQVADQLNRHRFFHADYVRLVLDTQIPAALRGLVSYELSGPDGALELRVCVNAEAEAEAAKLDGRYILVYHLPAEHEPDLPLKLHKRQYLVEHCFRNIRSDLAVNPVWLHHDSRIAGMMLVYVIALTLLALLGLAARRVGLATEYYHHMTPVAMLRRFGHLQVSLATARGQPDTPKIELDPTKPKSSKHSACHTQTRWCIDQHAARDDTHSHKTYRHTGAENERRPLLPVYDYPQRRPLVFRLRG